MAPSDFPAMPCVVHDQAAFVNPAVDGLVHLGGTLTARRGNLWKSIHVYLVHIILTVMVVYKGCHLFRLVLMHVAILIVCHKTNVIPPLFHNSRRICGIMNDLIYRHGSLFHSRDRQAANADIQQVVARTIQEAIIIVCGDRIYDRQ